MTFETQSNLKSNAVDYSVAAGKGIVSAIPFVGGIVAELVSSLVPNQRTDRISTYIVALEERLSDLEKDQRDDIASSPPKIDLFEEGAYQAARAFEANRLEYILHIVSHGLSGDQAAIVESKRLLQILNEIDEIQVIVLMANSRLHSRDPEFLENNRNVIIGPRAHMSSSREDLDKDIVHKTAKAGLVKLGLLQPTFRTPSKGELPEIDPKTGMMKSNGHSITPLGNLLLRRIKGDIDEV